MLNHSPKKRKDSLETRAVLLTLLLEIEIGVAGCTGNTSKHQKMATFSEEFLSEMTLRLF